MLRRVTEAVKQEVETFDKETVLENLADTYKKTLKNPKYFLEAQGHQTVSDMEVQGGGSMIICGFKNTIVSYESDSWDVHNPPTPKVIYKSKNESDDDNYIKFKSMSMNRLMIAEKDGIKIIEKRSGNVLSEMSGEILKNLNP